MIQQQQTNSDGARRTLRFSFGQPRPAILVLLVAVFLMAAPSAQARSSGAWVLVDSPVESRAGADRACVTGHSASGGDGTATLTKNYDGACSGAGGYCASETTTGSWQIPPARLTPGQTLRLSLTTSVSVGTGGCASLADVGVGGSTSFRVDTEAGGPQYSLSAVAQGSAADSGWARRAGETAEWVVREASPGGKIYLGFRVIGAGGSVQQTYVYEWQPGASVPATEPPGTSADAGIGEWRYQSGGFTDTWTLTRGGRASSATDPANTGTWRIEGTTLVVKWSNGWTNRYPIGPGQGPFEGEDIDPHRVPHRGARISRLVSVSPCGDGMGATAAANPDNCRWHAFTSDQRAFAAQPGKVCPFGSYPPGEYRILVGPAGRDGHDIPPPWWKSHGPFTFKAHDKWEAIADTHSMLHTKRDAATLLPYGDPGALAALYVRNMDTTQWQAICVVQDSPALAAGAIRVTSATYGANCGAPAGNVTPHIADQCDGKETCKYRVYYGDIGDPAHGCAKAYSVQYSCGGGSVRQESLDPEAGLGDKSVLLDCSGG